MFDELAERSLMSPLAGTKHTYVRLAIIVYCQILALFFQVSGSILVKATCAGLNSFFSALSTAHSSSNTRITFGKNAASKPQTREFFLCFVVKFFNSFVRLLFTFKRNCSVVIDDLERVNEVSCCLHSVT